MVGTENAEADNAAQSPPALESEGRDISGFWRRLLAFLIDGLVLMVVGQVAGYWLFDFFARLGPSGRGIGFCVALIYFGILNSAVAGGQTVGKRVMNIEVVNRSGQHISVARSCLRYVILGTPFFLNGAVTSPTLILPPVGYLISFLVFGLGVAIVYLFVFNRRTRQSLHDLICGTFVTKTASSGEVEGSIWRPHLVIVGLLSVTVIVTTVVLSGSVKSETIDRIVKLQRAVLSSHNVHSATVKVATHWRFGGDSSGTRYVQVNAFWKQRPDDYESKAHKVASTVMETYPDIMEKDRLAVTVIYGYDIGIARASKYHGYAYSPSGWQKVLSGEAAE